MDTEYRCVFCGKEITETQWRITFKDKETGFEWYLHETPCFGSSKNMSALRERALQKAQRPHQMVMF